MNYELAIKGVPLHRDSIIKLLAVIVELKRIKRQCRSNKGTIQWMGEFHRRFEDNTSFAQSTRDQIQGYIDLCNLKIAEIKLQAK